MGLQHLPNQNRGHLLVGHLNPHHGNFIGDGGNAHAGGAQRQSNIVRQIGNFRELHALIQHKFIPGDGGAVDHVAGLCLHTKAGQGVRQTAGVVPQLGTRLPVVLHAVFPQQRDGGILVHVLPGGHFLLDFRHDGGSGGLHLPCDGGFLFARLRRLRLRNGGGRRGGGNHRGHWGHRRHRDGLHRSRRGRDGRRAGGGRFRPLCQHLVRGLLLVRFVAEKAGDAPGRRLRRKGRAVQRNVKRRTNGGAARWTNGRLLLRFGNGRLLIARAGTVPRQQGAQHPVERKRQQQRQRRRKEDGGYPFVQGGHSPLRQRTGEHAAGFQCLAGIPQILYHGESEMEFGLCQQHMAQPAHRQGRQQGTGHPQGHRPAPVKQEDAPRQHQCRTRHPIAVPEQAPQHLGKPVDKNCLTARIAHQDAQCQHQHHPSADFPAKWLFGGRRGLFGPGGGLFGGGS